MKLYQVLFLLLITGMSGSNFVFADENQMVTSDQAKQLLIDGNLNESLEIYNTLINNSPETPDYWNNRGVVLLRLGNCEEAMKSFEKVNIIDPAMISGKINAAEAALCMNNIDVAIAYLQEGVNLSPDDVALWSNLGALQYEKNDLISALSSYKHAYEINKTYPDVMHKRAELNFITGSYAQALSLYQEIVKNDPEDELAWFNLGVTYEALSQYRDAINAYNQTEKLNASNFKAIQNIGNIYWMHDKYPETIEAMDKVIKLNPSYSDAWFIKGQALKAVGNLTQAKEAFEKASSLAPDDETKKAYSEKYSELFENNKTEGSSTSTPLPGTLIVIGLIICSLILFIREKE